MPIRSAQSTAGGRRRVAPVIMTGVLALTLLVGPAPAARAQESGDGFLFAAPKWTMTLRGGYDRATAGSDIFRFMTSTLTLKKGDFSGYSFGGELAYSVSPRVDIAFGASYVRARKVSEFIEYVGSDDLPINQTTTFSRLPVTASVKAYLIPRGRSIGSFAWIPSRFAPYVGAGAGALRYEFVQKGEFVDVGDGSGDSFEIFYDHFASAGSTSTAHALAGAELSLTPRLGLSTEARYGWAKSELGEDFVDFDKIDLSGLSATMGLTIRF